MRRLFQMDVPDWAAQMVKFGVKGGVGVIVNMLMLTTVVDVGGIPSEWGVPVVWLITLVPGYLVTDWWVFSEFSSPSSVSSHARQGIWFYAVLWTGKAANYGIYLALLSVGLWYQAAWVIGAIVVFPFIFAGNRLVWKHKPTLRKLLGRNRQSI